MDIWMAALNRRLIEMMPRVWLVWRSPKTTGALLVSVMLVLLTGWMLPQQAEPVVTAVAWRNSLPAWLQPAGETLFALGLAQVFHSLWFWLPVALLLLNSLLALADNTPGAWRRLKHTCPPLTWQHPLARRIEQSMRLPGQPDDFLQRLKMRLQAQGFLLYTPVETEQRLIGAARRRWAWLSITAFYTGVIGLIAAFLITYYTAVTDHFTLLPFMPRSVLLLKGNFELTDVDPLLGMSRIAYTSYGVDTAPQMLTWRLYQPALWQNILILPVAINPQLTVEVRDNANKLLTLMPLQEDLSPAERLSLPLTNATTPLYFTIPVAGLAAQVSPGPTAGVYQVQVRHVADAGPVQTITVSPEEPFRLGDFSGMLFLNHSVTVQARREPAWPLYLVSIGLMLTGVVVALWRPPTLIWLVSEVKGLGGQLYGIMETFGVEARANQFLQALLEVTEE
jgi:hypothetical protein